MLPGCAGYRQDWAKAVRGCQRPATPHDRGDLRRCGGAGEPRAREAAGKTHALLTSARQGDLWRCACWAWGAGCISCCVRYADGGGLTAAGRQRREAVRRQVAVLFEQKIKPLEVAQRLRVSRKSAYQWHQLWGDGGIEALVSRGPSGSRCRLSSRCLEKLAAYQSRDLCSALGGLSLLELDSARGGRVRLHDVIRDLPRSRLVMEACNA
jgi:hypothetical protein